MDACCSGYRKTNRPSQAAAEQSCHRAKAVKGSQKVNSAEKVPATSFKISGIGLAAITMAASAMIEPEKKPFRFRCIAWPIQSVWVNCHCLAGRANPQLSVAEAFLVNEVSPITGNHQTRMTNLYRMHPSMTI